MSGEATRHTDLPFRIRLGVVAGAHPCDPVAFVGVEEHVAKAVFGLFDGRSREFLESVVHTPIAYEVLVASTAPNDSPLARRLFGLRGAQPSARPDKQHRSTRDVVESSDVLVALVSEVEAADSAEIAAAIEYARVKGRPVVRVPATTPHELTVERGHGLNAAAVERLEMFNGFDLRATDVAAYIANLERDVFDNPEGQALPAASVALVRERLAPFYARASTLAKRNQKLYQRAGKAVWALFPLATAAVAVALLVPRFGTLAFAVHLVLLLLMAGIVFAADRARSHEKWLECRFVTERLRSGIFLAACGFEATPLRVPPFMGRESWRSEWVVRAFDEIWRRLPRLEGCDGSSCTPMVAFVRRRWLEDQIAFHDNKAATCRRLSHRLESAGRALFVVAVLVAIAHLVVPLVHHAEGGAARGGALFEAAVSSEDLLLFLAIVLPGAGAALGGYRSHREYSRLAKRSANMALELRELAQRLDEVRDPDALGDLLREAEQMMLAEVQDWLMLMRFVPVESPG